MNHIKAQVTATIQGLGEKKILLVDEEYCTQLFIKRLLEKKGFYVQISENGQEALAELQENKYDLVLMDIRMPVMDGIEATKKIRAAKTYYSNIPVVAMTACAMHGERERFLAAGMDDYISKPVDKDHLLQVLCKNLSQKP